MASIPKKVAERLVQGLKRYQPVLAAAKAHDVGAVFPLFLVLLLLSTTTINLQAESGAALTAASTGTNLESVLLDTKVRLKNRPPGISISFQKIRGNEVGGSRWDNEEWAYKIDFKSIPSRSNFQAQLNFYDQKGFVLYKEFVSIERAADYKNGSFSDNFYLPLAAIDKIASVGLEGDGLKRE